MREDVKKLKGCMKPEVSEDGEDIFHEIALDLANECDPCLDLIIAHQRREERERCARIAGECVLPFGHAIDYPGVIMARILDLPAPSTDGTGLCDDENVTHKWLPAYIGGFTCDNCGKHVKELHKLSTDGTSCKHQWSGICKTSLPPQYGPEKCVLCGATKP